MKTTESKEINTISNFQAQAIKKVSELDITDPKAMKEHVQNLNAQNQVIESTKNAFVQVHNKLDAVIRVHLRTSDEVFSGSKKAHEDGNLKFKNPAKLHLHHDSGLDETIGSTDSAVNYQFLMFRDITNSTVNFGPNVTLRDDYNKAWSKASLLASFDYKDGEKFPMKAFIEKGGKMQPNQAAVKILKNDKEELMKLIETSFDQHRLECNTLKTTQDAYIQGVVCSSFTDAINPERVIKGYTCFETFNLAKVPGLCEEIDYESEHLDF